MSPLINLLTTTTAELIGFIIIVWFIRRLIFHSEHISVPRFEPKDGKDHQLIPRHLIILAFKKYMKSVLPPIKDVHYEKGKFIIRAKEIIWRDNDHIVFVSLDMEDWKIKIFDRLAGLDGEIEHTEYDFRMQIDKNETMISVKNVKAISNGNENNA
jgi:hypothetical protein